jgi:signal transduction histidine kinase
MSHRVDVPQSHKTRGRVAIWGTGIDLSSMRERAAELGGSCTVEAPPSGGTCVRAYLPLERDCRTKDDMTKLQSQEEE